MTIEEKHCEECGRSRSVCGECGSSFVTPVDYVKTPNQKRTIPETTSLKETLMRAEDGEVVEFASVCWDCGWKKVRKVEVNIETDEGN